MSPFNASLHGYRAIFFYAKVNVACPLNRQLVVIYFASNFILLQSFHQVVF